jgi:hypothetical protein
MQNTRLSTLIDRISQQFNRWTTNPWRRLSLIVISLLFGNFLASAISTSTGQRTELDTVISLVLLIFTESISWLVYGSAIGRRDLGERNDILDRRPIYVVLLNSLKLGLIYGLFVEAFKLGS